MGNSNNNGRSVVQTTKTRRNFIKKPYLLTESDPMYRKPKSKKVLNIRLPRKVTIVDRLKRKKIINSVGELKKYLIALCELICGFILGWLIGNLL